MVNLKNAWLASLINNILVYVMYASIILMEITRNVYIRESLVCGLWYKEEQHFPKGTLINNQKPKANLAWKDRMKDCVEMADSKKMDEANLRHSLPTELWKSTTPPCV